MACLLDMGWWGLPDVDIRVRLQKAWADFCYWKSANKVTCSQRPFTFGMLFKANHGAYLSCKGFNSRVLCSWLATEAQKAWQGTANPSDELSLMTHALPLGSTRIQFPAFALSFFVDHNRNSSCCILADSNHWRTSISSYMDLSERFLRFPKLGSIGNGFCT